jgi:hypothetical protein
MSEVVQRRISIHPGSIRRTVEVLVTALFLLNVNSIEASCGDYLHGAGQHSAFDENRERVSLSIVTEAHFSEKAVPMSRDSSVPRSSLPRCSGPFCQPSPLVPAGHSFPAQQRSVDKEMCLTNESGIAEQDFWSHLDRSSEVSTEAPELPRVDRPPQA